MSTRIALHAFIRIKSKLSLSELATRICLYLFSTEAVEKYINGNIESYTLGADILGIKLQIRGCEGNYVLKIFTKSEVLCRVKRDELKLVYIDDYLIQLLADLDVIDSISKP